MVMTYGWFQRSFNPEKQYNPMIHLCAGAVAGGVASVVTMPWDVCKTLLNTQEPGVLNKIGQTEVRGLMNAAYIVWKTNRITGFYKGLTPRVLYQVRWDMSTIIAISRKVRKNEKIKNSYFVFTLFHGKNYISRLLQQLFLGACMKVSNICG